MRRLSQHDIARDQAPGLAAPEASGVRPAFRHGAQAAIARRVATVALTGVLALGLAGCGASTDAGGDASSQDEPAATTAEAAVGEDGAIDVTALADESAMDFEYSKRDADASYDASTATTVDLAAGTVQGDGATFDAATGTLTVSAEGTYVLSGTRDQGQIVVDADKDTAKVQLVLDGVTLRNQTGPALYVKGADKVFVTLADGSQNSLSDGADYQLEEGEDEPNGAVFSKDDLTFNGTGSLTVSAAYRHGIVSKDDLVIAGGTYVVTAAEDGLRGRDCLKVADGSLTVDAVGDALKSNNDEDASRGFITIDGGTLRLVAGDDGVDAHTLFRVTGGDVTVEAADDAFHSEVLGRVTGGTVEVNAGDDAFHAEFELSVDGGEVNVASCVEGYEAEKVYVTGGSSRIVASDDAVNASIADLREQALGGDAAAAGDPGADAAGDGQMPELPDGQQQDPGAGQMPDGQMPQGGAPGAGGDQQMPDGAGQMPQAPDAADAGTDAQAGRGGRGGFDKADGQQRQRLDGAEDFGGGRGGFGGGMAGTSEECLIQVSGGTLVVVAGGDGIDSNGSIEVTGGTVLVTGPTNSADSALDYELEATIDGGTVLAVGPMGMATGFTGGTQPSALVSASGRAGDTVALVGPDGSVLAAFTAEAAFQSVVISAPGLAEGDACQVVVGGTLSGSQDEDGCWRGGTVTGGTTVTATVSTEGSAGGFGGPGGGFGGQRGQRGQDFGGTPGAGQGTTTAGSDAAGAGQQGRAVEGGSAAEGSASRPNIKGEVTA